MKHFLSFVKKEFLHILRDKRTMLIAIGMPVVQIILFGFAISTELTNVQLGVLNYSNDNITGQIIDKFAASSYFTIKENLSSQGQIDEALKANKIDAVLVFGPKFDGNLKRYGRAEIQLVINASDPNFAQMATSYATNIVNSAQEAFVGNKTSQKGIKQIVIIPEVQMLYNPQLKGAYNFVPGVMGLVLTLICAMSTAISIVREKESGTMEVLLVSPVKPIYIILSKAIPYFTLSIVNIITILLLAVFVLGVPIKGSLFLLIAVSLLFTLVCLSIGLMISNIVATQVGAMMISGMALMMPTMLLSGMMFPIASMPKILQIVSNFVPAKFYISAVKKVMIEGLGFEYIMEEFFIIVAFAVVLILVSILKFNKRIG